MTPEQHARAKELFLRARKLEVERREQFLQSECSDDEEVRQEVASLLRHDRPATILASDSRPPKYSHALVGRPRVRLLGRIERVVTRLLQQLIGSSARVLVVLACMLFLLLGLAYWTNAGMRRATELIAQSQLQTIRDADATALELWIEEKKKDVRLWSSRTEMRQAVGELVQLAEISRDQTADLLASPALANLRTLLEEYDRIIGSPERDAVLNREGLALAAAEDENVGRRLNNDGLTALVRVFQGDTIFLKPHPNGAFGLDRVPDLNLPMVYVVAPVRGPSDRNDVIAAAAFGFPADNEFTEILSIARLGQTGETYTFDENGRLLSESRFDEDLRLSGLLPEDPETRSIFRVEIREPGGPSMGQPLSPIELAERPFTTLAAKAIAASRKGGESDLAGVVLEPYRNYRGARVIGAWKWLPDYAFGVATEVDVDELYAPIRFPVIAEWIRFGLFVGCLLTLLGAAGWIAVLGRDVDEARILGQYTLQEQIGEGGMGVVYRARHALLQRETAIKLLRPENVGNEASLIRFEREVQLASSLTHPNTIDIFDFGRTPEGSFYCVMELLDGRTLEELVRSEGPLPATRAVNILTQIAGSLNEAHRRGLIHRDIKPANIMLCEQGGIADFVKVLDFGLARNIERSDAGDVTQVGLIAGTPLYLAPERLTDPLNIDQRSDLYAFGAVGYYLLTAQNIFDYDSQSELLQKVLHENQRRPSEVTSNQIPSQLEALLLRCLARRPDQRPDTMLAVISQLSQIEAEL